MPPVPPPEVRPHRATTVLLRSNGLASLRTPETFDGLPRLATDAPVLALTTWTCWLVDAQDEPPSWNVTSMSVEDTVAAAGAAGSTASAVAANALATA